MTSQQESMGSNIEHASSMEALVNAEPQVDLWDAAGHRIAVPQSDLQHWMSLGFSRDAIDPHVAAAELRPMADAVTAAIEQVIAGCEADGYIDTAEAAAMATAETALAEFVATGAKVLRAIHARFPVRQGQGVQMRNPEGVVMEVDPGQVEERLAAGWTQEG